MVGSVTRIIGIGNRLMGDDGVGITAIEMLGKENLPVSVELIDGGCGGVTLLQLLEGCRRAVIIDAADFSAQPGTVSILRNPNPSQWPQEQPARLSHQQGLQEVLLLAGKLDRLPQVSLILVQVETCQPRLQLSAPVTAALPELVQIILQEIHHPDIPGPGCIHSQH